jgi:hypothetical protein
MSGRGVSIARYSRIRRLAEERRHAMPLCVNCYKNEVAADEVYCESCKAASESKGKVFDPLEGNNVRTLRNAWHHIAGTETLMPNHEP